MGISQVIRYLNSQRILDTDCEFEFGQAVILKEGKSLTPSRYVCSIPAGVDPTPIVAKVAELLTLPRPQPWAPKPMARRVVINARGRFMIRPARWILPIGARKPSSVPSLVHDYGLPQPTTRRSTRIEGVPWH